MAIDFIAPRRKHPSAPDISALLDRLAPGLRIAHHIPGRLRLTLDLAAFGDLKAVDRFVKALPEVTGILDIRLNAVARSCVIRYDPTIIPAVAWTDMLQGRSTEPALALALLLGERLAA